MEKRYSSVAISLHWLIALLLIGLVAIAKVMNSLPDSDPLRFSLIQVHKSFGILALLLVVLRVFWRFTHRPPRLNTSVKMWERVAADATHLVLYFLMLVIPLSGWLMVSASPLNLKTELFGLIPWPHIALVSELPGRAELAEQLVEVHHWLANGMLLLVLLHIVAALRHHFVLRDGLMSRMIVSADDHQRRNMGHGIVFGLLIAGAGSIYLLNHVSNTAKVTAVNASLNAGGDAGEQGFVTFEASQLGDPVHGKFDDVQVVLVLDVNDPATSTLTAKINTSSVNTGDGQIDSTVVTSDWFASADFPFATFSSTGVVVESVDSRYEVTGDLTIRDITQSIVFVMTLKDGMAKGEFDIDRTSFEVGVGGQDDFVAPEVRIRFSVKPES